MFRGVIGLTRRKEILGVLKKHQKYCCVALYLTVMPHLRVLLRYVVGGGMWAPYVRIGAQIQVLLMS